MEKPVKDPTREEMLEFIAQQYRGCHEMLENESAEAIHQFASEYHAGQNSNLYSALSQSEFRPGPMWSQTEEKSFARDIYNSLVEEYREDSDSAQSD